jgi:hypothetical protein
MAYDGRAPRWLVNPEIRGVFFNILRRQRDEDIANQNRAIIAAIIAANVGGPVAPALAPAIIAANVVPPGPPPGPNVQQDSNDPNIGCIGTPDDPNIGCVSIAQ